MDRGAAPEGDVLGACLRAGNGHSRLRSPGHALVGDPQSWSVSVSKSLTVSSLGVVLVFVATYPARREASNASAISRASSGQYSWGRG